MSKISSLYVFLLFLIVIFFFNFTIYADQTNTIEAVIGSDQTVFHWLSYDQAITKSKVENIPTLIYFYSDQCGWCRKLENETLDDEKVKAIMVKNFSTVKINSNSSKTVIENGKKITEKQLSEQVYQVKGTPTIWFLTSDNKRIASLPGYVKPDMLINVLNYIKDGSYKKVTFQEYMEQKNNQS
ncbi:MAG: thioredoxin fold domain-containing protein [Candidatus Atribacteria bacterium]|nr:thioredoxin fold domain-containing protein [Candidatus Atribacteria bacterium]